MRAFARVAYRFVLQLHPDAFRAEFGDEMLWIFDEHTHCREAGMVSVVLYAQLFLDALRSAFIQNALREHSHSQAIGPHFRQIGSSARVVQIAQGSFIIFNCLCGIFLIVLFLQMVISNL
jgi:hypothetical protein